MGIEKRGHYQLITKDVNGEELVGVMRDNALTFVTKPEPNEQPRMTTFQFIDYGPYWAIKTFNESEPAYLEGDQDRRVHSTQSGVRDATKWEEIPDGDNGARFRHDTNTPGVRPVITPDPAHSYAAFAKSLDEGNKHQLIILRKVQPPA
ncbi:hypothetical protein ADK76_08215 [Streptomyces griseoflavus]|uniref:hypothetical protein n=1 Tax=Streptomyces rimosus TaxID=1927 RepID=UPI0004C85D69|nr:hypothetical protein [Streptomyces rimosus]KOG64939.1 hypothetical protein ADK76_08215 [Streptomyces griseoflavus]